MPVWSFDSNTGDVEHTVLSEIPFHYIGKNTCDNDLQGSDANKYFVGMWEGQHFLLITTEWSAGAGYVWHKGHNYKVLGLEVFKPTVSNVTVEIEE